MKRRRRRDGCTTLVILESIQIKELTTQKATDLLPFLFCSAFDIDSSAEVAFETAVYRTKILKFLPI